MWFNSEIEPDDTDLPGDWRGGAIYSTSQGLHRLFINESRELCIHYINQGDRIQLTTLRDRIQIERLDKPEKEPGKEPSDKESEISYIPAGSEKEISYLHAGGDGVALDKSIILMERVEDGHIEYE